MILEFDSVEAARRWYDSAQYQAIVGQLLAAAAVLLVMMSVGLVLVSPDVDRARSLAEAAALRAQDLSQ